MSDYPEFYSENKHRARKQHVCTECQKAIEPKQEYIAISGKWYGEFQSYTHCLDCHVKWNHAYALVEHPEDGPRFGELLEWWDNEGG